MEQPDVIRQLQSLKSVKPNSHTLRAIERNIFLRLETGERDSVWERIQRLPSRVFVIFKSNPFTAYSTAAVLLIVVYLSISTGFLPGVINTAWFNVKIATAPNQYVKASLALSQAQAKIDNASFTNETKINDLFRSVALANSELAGLHLMGEEGKYTSQQCQELYRNYLRYLGHLDRILSIQAKFEPIEQLDAQIKLYEQQAESRLDQYKK